MILMKIVANISRLKENGFILIDDVPCRISKISRSTSGKHGAAKIRVDANGLLDGKRKSVVKPSGENVDVPIINRDAAQVLSIVGKRVQLMDTKTYEVFELDIPEELSGKLTEGEETNYFEVVGIRTLKQIK